LGVPRGLVRRASKGSKRLPKRSVWDPSVEVEESPYFWRGEPKVIPPLAPLSSSVTGPTAAELFCGAGGLSKGAEMAGFYVILGLDIHKPSAETFHLNHRHAYTILGDIREVKPEDVSALLGARRVDVLMAGVPCQGFSLNNRKRNERDKRNYLFLEFIRFVKALQPRAVLLENVSGLRSTANGSFAKAIEQAISDAGPYTVVHTLLNAADYGVPQVRERIFFVGLPKNVEFAWPQPTHGPGREPYRTVWEAISDLPTLRPGEQATEYATWPLCDYQRMMRVGAERLLNHRAPNHPQATRRKIGRTKPGEPIYPRFKQRIRLSWEQPSPTQVAGGIRPQYQFGHPSQPRGLTVRERARIQSFPDTYEFCGGLVQGRVQTGNAVPPLLAKAIFEALKDAIARERQVDREAQGGNTEVLAPVGP
jgi:DNA (cytosine-5)-methyltransferase 1